MGGPAAGAAAVPGGPIDYASKHWSGLIRDYYAHRVALVTQQALQVITAIWCPGERAASQPEVIRAITSGYCPCLCGVVQDAAAGKPLDATALNVVYAAHAYNWTTATNPYPTEVVGDYVAVSKAMRAKYQHYFTSCAA